MKPADQARAELVEHFTEILHHAATALVRLGGLPEPSDVAEGIDEALIRDSDFQHAKRAVYEALRSLRHVVSELDHDEALLRAEAALNAALARASDVGFRMGLLVGRAGR